MKNRKIWIYLIIIVVVTFVLMIIDRSIYKEYSKDYFYMDTYINVKVNTVKNKNEMDSLFDDIDYLYGSYHKLTDRYNQYDDVINVYYLNEILKDGEGIKIDNRLSDIIMLGIDYYNKSDGMFNIASGNLTSIWKNFIDICDVVPSNFDTNINIDDIDLEDDIYTKYNDIKLDLGGIAKGYVTEIVGNYLEEKGIDSYIINAGGNVKVGSSYNKDSYVVGITNPDDTSNIFTKVNINNLSVVTSGNYQRYCEIDGNLYSHIINPITKNPSNYMKSVSVISNSSSIGDIYSTYLYLLPVDKGLEIVNNTPGIEAIWYIDKDNIIKSDGFDYE